MSRRRRCCACPGDDTGGGDDDCVSIPDLMAGTGLDGDGGPCTTTVNIHYNVTPGEGSIPDLFRDDTIETICPDYTVITLIYYRIAGTTATRQTFYPGGSSSPVTDIPICVPGGGGESGELTVCVVGCDGEPLVGAYVFAWSDDPSGPFSTPPLTDGPDPMPTATGEDGCVTLNYPLSLDPGASVSITVNYPPGYQPTTLTDTLADLSAGATITPDVAGNYTCCDMAFRKDGDPPVGPYSPRADVLFFVTSGAANPDEIWDISVDCDGTACSLSDSLAVIGGAPVLATCPGTPASANMDWDYWTTPTLTTGRVPAVVKVWYDGDWHCEIKAYYTVAEPPRPDLGACSVLQGWFRSDAPCSDAADPKLSTPSDPTVTNPFQGDGGASYPGSTFPVTITASSYTINANNPVDITFHFGSTVVSYGDWSATVTLVDSITVWQP